MGEGEKVASGEAVSKAQGVRGEVIPKGPKGIADSTGTGKQPKGIADSTGTGKQPEAKRISGTVMHGGRVIFRWSIFRCGRALIVIFRWNGEAAGVIFRWRAPPPIWKHACLTRPHIWNGEWWAVGSRW